MRVFANSVPFVVSGSEGLGEYSWYQKTIYKEPPRNHAYHLARAEEKRLRKAAKLIEIEKRLR